MTTPKPAKLVQAYLNFDGRCEEAVEFYRNALGAEVDALMRFKDSPEPDQCAPGSADKIMHASFRIGETTLMASDCHGAGKPDFNGFSLSLSVPTEAEADQYFAALSEGGQSRDATREDVLVAAFRRGLRPLRRQLDGERPGLRRARPRGEPFVHA